MHNSSDIKQIISGRTLQAIGRRTIAIATYAVAQNSVAVVKRIGVFQPLAIGLAVEETIEPPFAIL